MGGAYRMHKQTASRYSILFGKHAKKEGLLGDPKFDGILKGRGCKDLDWIYSLRMESGAHDNEISG
jgi:hypothetical protein